MQEEWYINIEMCHTCYHLEESVCHSEQMYPPSLPAKHAWNTHLDYKLLILEVQDIKMISQPPEYMHTANTVGIIWKVKRTLTCHSVYEAQLLQSKWA